MNHDECRSYVEVLRRRTEETPERTAYIFLGSTGKEDLRLSYAELDRRARGIAAVLSEHRDRDARALLVFAPDSRYIVAFWGCLYAGVTAVPVYPPDAAHLARSLSRLEAIVGEARPQFVLTSSDLMESRLLFIDRLPAMKQLCWVATDLIPHATECLWRDPSVDANCLAFLQYTSGSTGDPKGVMISHGNLLFNVDRIQRATGAGPDDSVVSWLPPYHDMGLIGGLLFPVYVGVPGISMAPMTFLKRPYRWLEAISRYRATMSVAPNFAYELCVRKIRPEDCDGLDLTRWAVALSGAEPVRVETLVRFHHSFARCGFRWESHYPTYGLAEGTLMVSGPSRVEAPRSATVDRGALGGGRIVDARPGSANGVELVACGRTLEGQDTLIVDPETCRVCAADRVGEIWVAGPAVGQGYWSRPEETERVFRARVMSEPEGVERSRCYLRTGDLGFLREGHLFIVGRLSDVMIVRGQNHHPEDIERSVNGCHPVLRPGCGAVFQTEEIAGDGVVVVWEVRSSDIDVHEVAKRISEAVWEWHELIVGAVLLLPARSIPKTSSGKVQRRPCRQHFLESGFGEVVGEWRHGAARRFGD